MKPTKQFCAQNDTLCFYGIIFGYVLGRCRKTYLTWSDKDLERRLF